jgi:hypothetical protein
MVVRYNIIKSILVRILPAIFFLFIYGFVDKDAAAEISWKTFETKHTIIKYLSFEDLEKFNQNLNYGDDQWSLNRLFSDSESSDVFQVLKKKVDILFNRVQEILDMRKKMKKVTIHLYHNRAQLNDAYFKIYNKPCRIRAWYIYQFNTVYLGADDMHEGMLAHELAHSIIDHYLLVRPPKATAEILARYIDEHLYK